MIKSCVIFGTRFSNNENNLVLTENEYMGPKLTQAEGFILGVGAKMFSCCGARCAPCWRRSCVAHRPRPLAQAASSATGGAPIAPQRRPADRVRCQRQRGVWVHLLDNYLVLNIGEVFRLPWDGEPASYNKKGLTSLFLDYGKITGKYISERTEQPTHTSAEKLSLPCR